jgi:cell division protein FtsB
LNAEQLARKRANDREAQRSIRQRTKDHVERLENRIRELTEGQYVNLEEVQMRNAELERELRELKDGLQMNDDGMGSDYGGSPGTFSNP